MGAHKGAITGKNSKVHDEARDRTGTPDDSIGITGTADDDRWLPDLSECSASETMFGSCTVRLATDGLCVASSMSDVWMRLDSASADSLTELTLGATARCCTC